MFIFHILLLLTLALDTNQQQIAGLFQVSSFGTEFIPVSSNDLVSLQTSVRSMTWCVMACLNNIKCYTVDYDSLSLLCRLFSVWMYEGTIGQSASLSTSRIAYIERKPILYFLYGQMCDTQYAVNRFLWCINSQWSCPTGQFFNGSICQNILTTTTTTTTTTTKTTTTTTSSTTTKTTTTTTTTTTTILVCSCWGTCTGYRGSSGYPAACGSYTHDYSGYSACVYDADNGYIGGSSNNCNMCCGLGSGTFVSSR